MDRIWFSACFPRAPSPPEKDSEHFWGQLCGWIWYLLLEENRSINTSYPEERRGGGTSRISSGTLSSSTLSWDCGPHCSLRLCQDLHESDLQGCGSSLSHQPFASHSLQSSQYFLLLLRWLHGRRWREMGNMPEHSSWVKAVSQRRSCCLCCSCSRLLCQNISDPS